MYIIHCIIKYKMNKLFNYAVYWLNFRRLPFFAIFAVSDIISQVLPSGLNFHRMKLSRVAADP